MVGTEGRREEGASRPVGGEPCRDTAWSSRPGQRRRRRSPRRAVRQERCRLAPDITAAIGDERGRHRQRGGRPPRRTPAASTAAASAARRATSYSRVLARRRTSGRWEISSPGRLDLDEDDDRLLEAGAQPAPPPRARAARARRTSFFEPVELPRRARRRFRRPRPTRNLERRPSVFRRRTSTRRAEVRPGGRPADPVDAARRGEVAHAVAELQRELSDGRHHRERLKLDEGVAAAGEVDRAGNAIDPRRRDAFEARLRGCSSGAGRCRSRRGLSDRARPSPISTSGSPELISAATRRRSEGVLVIARAWTTISPTVSRWHAAAVSAQHGRKSVHLRSRRSPSMRTAAEAFFAHVVEVVLEMVGQRHRQLG